jgi:hypothetical protein
MKVTPIATIKNGAAAIPMRAKFRRDAKFGFKAVKKTTSANKTMIGISVLGFRFFIICPSTKNKAN